MKYQTPVMAELGAVAALTRGECSWGFENTYLDKSGATYYVVVCQQGYCRVCAV
jgi:hypothetical protein